MHGLRKWDSTDKRALFSVNADRRGQSWEVGAACWPGVRKKDGEQLKWIAFGV